MAGLKAVPVAFAGIIGAAGLTLLTTSEGKHNTVYLDPVGIPTVCWGHTGRDVKIGDRWSDDLCRQTLLRDVQIAQRYIVPASPVSCLGGAPLTGNQRDALTSLVFNIGGPRFCSSTLAKRLRSRDYLGASRQFPLWNKARVNNRVVALPGLTKRRRAEQLLFLTVDRPEPVSSLSGQATAIIITPVSKD